MSYTRLNAVFWLAGTSLAVIMKALPKLIIISFRRPGMPMAKSFGKRMMINCPKVLKIYLVMVECLSIRQIRSEGPGRNDKDSIFFTQELDSKGVSLEHVFPFSLAVRG